MEIDRILLALCETSWRERVFQIYGPSFSLISFLLSRELAEKLSSGLFFTLGPWLWYYCSHGRITNFFPGEKVGWLATYLWR